MPTPSESTVGPAPPLIESFSSRASFASCPPDDERERHALRDERVDTPQPQGSALETDDERAATPQPSAAAADRQAPPATSPDGPAPEPAQEKGRHVKEAASDPEDDAAGTVASPEAPSESDASRLPSTARTSTPPLSPTEEPLYLTFPRDKSRLLPSTTSSFLRPGSKFVGTQQSDRQVYDVQVEIKDVNMAESFLCGYLRIQGLTDDHPTLTTYFEGEIIGPKHLFKTTHPSWNASDKVDWMHWARFSAWHPLAKSAKNPNFTLKNYAQRPHLFMRWKEYFLVPDHRVKTIAGASFEGFYYICFNQCEGSVSGIYYHAKSEKYQQLELKHVNDMGCMGAMEFR